VEIHTYDEFLKNVPPKEVLILTIFPEEVAFALL
jgi:hypothetical protein